jgi:hypothetical protein
MYRGSYGERKLAPPNESGSKLPHAKMRHRNNGLNT